MEQFIIIAKSNLGKAPGAKMEEVPLMVWVHKDSVYVHPVSEFNSGVSITKDDLLKMAEAINGFEK